MQNFANKFGNPDKVNNSLRKYKLSKLFPDIENLISKKTSKIIPMLYKLYQGIEKKIKNFPTHFIPLAKPSNQNWTRGAHTEKKLQATLSQEHICKCPKLKTNT